MPRLDVYNNYNYSNNIVNNPSRPLVITNPIAQTAIWRVQQHGLSYAKAKAPTSPFPNLSGNSDPGTSHIKWLANRFKCNQFVGDVLYQSGYAMPTYKMDDGSEHYMNAETLPRQTKYFKRIKSYNDIHSGDIFVMDYGAFSGSNGAHTEVIITGKADGTLISAGAHRDGATVSDSYNLLTGAIYNSKKQCWQIGKNSLYVLRPIKQVFSPSLVARNKPNANQF